MMVILERTLVKLPTFYSIGRLVRTLRAGLLSSNCNALLDRSFRMIGVHNMKCHGEDFTLIRNRLDGRQF